MSHVSCPWTPPPPLPSVPVLSAALQECITDSGNHMGVSRPTIKNYIKDRYGMEVTAFVISNINCSIAYVTEKGTFVLLKGACLCLWPTLCLTCLSKSLGQGPSLLQRCPKPHLLFCRLNLPPRIDPLMLQKRSVVQSSSPPQAHAFMSRIQSPRSPWHLQRR